MAHISVTYNEPLMYHRQLSKI